MSKPKVGIIVLNFNGKNDTLECLHSLEKIKTSNFEPVLYVVDNDSKDKSVETIREKFPKIDVLANSKNLGFSGGNNVGVRAALEKKVDYIFLLNNDTVVEPNFMEELISFAQSQKDGGIFGPALKFKKGFEIFYDLGGVINPLVGRTTHKTVSLLTNQLPKKVDYVSGAALLIKKEVIDKIGLLDEDYFFGFEDVEYCLLSRQNSFFVYNVPTAVVEHKISGSVGATSPLKIYYLLRNNLRFVYRNLLLPKNLAGYLYLMLLSGKMFLNSPRYLIPIMEAWRDFFTGRFGKKRD